MILQGGSLFRNGHKGSVILQRAVAVHGRDTVLHRGMGIRRADQGADATAVSQMGIRIVKMVRASQSLHHAVAYRSIHLVCQQTCANGDIRVDNSQIGYDSIRVDVAECSEILSCDSHTADDMAITVVLGTPDNILGIPRITIA